MMAQGKEGIAMPGVRGMKSIKPLLQRNNDTISRFPKAIKSGTRVKKLLKSTQTALEKNMDTVRISGQLNVRIKRLLKSARESGRREAKSMLKRKRAPGWVTATGRRTVQIS
ncbi:hypothetical protein BOW30_08715 [Solemya velum gill symbiont]|nr:hypothetical protein BOW29_08115 [Solemya velum gill symbiont]OOZ21700.1 hypothetical protein BOW30_08715 [Solemya velum gill symbiont]